MEEEVHIHAGSIVAAVWSRSRLRFFCESMDCRLPGSSVRGTFQARILEWVAVSYSRKSSQPKD